MTPREASAYKQYFWTIALLLHFFGFCFCISGVPPPVVDPQALHHPPDAPLVVVEVDDGVDAARAGQHGEADHGRDQQPRHLLFVLLSSQFLAVALSFCDNLKKVVIGTDFLSFSTTITCDTVEISS